MADNTQQRGDKGNFDRDRARGEKSGEKPMGHSGQDKNDYPSKEIGGREEDLSKGGKNDYPAKEVGGKEPGGRGHEEEQGPTESNTAGRDMEPTELQSDADKY